MNNDEARFLLNAYRADGRDAQDPQFAEALEQAGKDPSLASWLREQQAFDAAVTRKLQSVTVPAGLKSDILAGRKTIRPVAWWSRPLPFTAAAACLVVFLGLAAFWLRTPPEAAFADYRASMTHLIAQLEAGSEQLQLTSADFNEIQSWLRAHSSQTDFEVPQTIKTSTGIGCRVLQWHGKCVTLACFKLEGGQVAHLLVTSCSTVPDAPKEGERLMTCAGAMNTLAWSNGKNTYLLVSRADAQALQRLL